MQELAMILGLAAAAVLAALSAVHGFWAFGGAPTRGTAVPTTEDGEFLFRPALAATLFVAALLLLGGTTLLGRLGVLGSILPAPLYRLGTAGLALVLLARAIGDFRWVGFFKRQRATRFAALDSVVYVPCAGTRSLLRGGRHLVKHHQALRCPTPGKQTLSCASWAVAHPTAPPCLAWYVFRCGSKRSPLRSGIHSR